MPVLQTTVMHWRSVYTASGVQQIVYRTTVVVMYHNFHNCSSHSLTQDNPDRIVSYLSHVKGHMMYYCWRLAGLLGAVLELAGLFPLTPCWSGVDSREGPERSPDRAVSIALGERGEWQVELSSDSSSSSRCAGMLVSSCRVKRPKL